MRSKMSTEEYQGGLKRFGITQSEAAQLIWLKTGSVIRVDAVQTHISRHGSLSQPYTAVFRFLFRELQAEHERR